METHLSSYQGSIQANVEREQSQKPNSGLVKQNKTTKNWLSALTVCVPQKSASKMESGTEEEEENNGDKHQNKKF